MLRLHACLIVPFVVLITGASAYAQTTFSATLANSGENPPTNPTLSTGGPRPASFGTATFTLNAARTSMTFSATIFNIDFTGSQTPDPNDNLVAAHIHASPTASPTVNAGVVWGFFGSPFNDNNPNDVVITPFPNGVGGTISGKWDAPEGNGTTLAAQLPNILSGHSYINFHTTQFGGGEVRGPLVMALGITSSATLPTGVLGAAYSQALTTSGATPPNTWAVTSGALPAGLSLSSAGVLSGTPAAVGTSTFTAGVTDSAMAFSSQTFTLTILPSSLNFTSALRVAQVVDGGGFVTQFAIVNLDPSQVSFQFRFWGDDGNALSLPLPNSAPGDLAGTLAQGATAFVRTSGNSAPLLQGWAEVASTGRIGVLAIFRLATPGKPDSEATVMGTQSGSNIFLPFDNSQGFVTGVAVSNANPTQSVSVTMIFTSDTGAQSNAAITLPAHGHTAFVMPAAYSATAGARGSVRFLPSSPDIAVVGLRFSPNNSFTSLGSF
jgi:CHRD domain-containing protein/putative Ig domain-containing protein